MVDVSVVSTVHNEEDNFDKAPPSILGQKYRDFEWIIVDDNSTDRTWELLSELKNEDDRVKIRSAEDEGRSSALNQAVDEANGRYIANQDFDDVSFPDRLIEQKNFLDQHSEIGLVGSYHEHVDKIRDEHYIREVPIRHKDLVRELAKYIPFPHTLVMFRKKAWKDAGGYPEVTDIIDQRLWIKMANGGWELANIPKVLGRHHIYKSSSFNSKFRYSNRQRRLAKVQAKAIRDLNLPKWMYIYPVARIVYTYLPPYGKRFIRRNTGGIKEVDK